MVWCCPTRYGTAPHCAWTDSYSQDKVQTAMHRDQNYCLFLESTYCLDVFSLITYTGYFEKEVSHARRTIAIAFERLWDRSRMCTYWASGYGICIQVLCQSSRVFPDWFEFVHAKHPKNTHGQNFTPFEGGRPRNFAHIFYGSMRNFPRTLFLFSTLKVVTVFRGSHFVGETPFQSDPRTPGGKTNLIHTSLRNDQKNMCVNIRV